MSNDRGMEVGMPCGAPTWFPISSAPKDGTVVDLWTNLNRRIPGCSWKERGCWSERKGWESWGFDWQDSHGEALQEIPTHWTAPPEGPNE